MKLFGFFACFLMLLSAVSAEPAIRVVPERYSPYGGARPGQGETDVPLRTSFYLPFFLEGGEAGDKMATGSLSVVLERPDGKKVHLVQPGPRFARGYRGEVAATGYGPNPGFTAWLDSDKSLDPLTTYVLHVSARSEKGVEIPPEVGTWSFVTEEKPRPARNLLYKLDLSASPVAWHGGFFTGICQPGVSGGFEKSYEQMLAEHKKYPRAWSLHRMGVTGMQRQPDMWSPGAHNIVRERETRRIAAMEKTPRGTLLRVEDFFGHEQYGIPSDRPVSADYHPGDEVTVADGVISTRTLVVETNDAEHSVLVKPFGPDTAGWKIAYSGPLPNKPETFAPGLFPPGGCYLYKFKPTGVLQYYWGRLDHEIDVIFKKLGQRWEVNFTGTPGDVSGDGNGGGPKDYAELHEAIREITSHIIERCGEASYDFYWGLFNEIDLAPATERTPEAWNEHQTFYDYTVDAVCRAFEDHGLDSSRAIVGGLELGGIFGTNLRVGEFLGHCSPTTTTSGALPVNAAYADKRLDGKRSQRVDRLCASHGGDGSPLDFISIHCYNTSEMMAQKLIRTKEMALEVDPAYYDKLIITSYECAPNWSLPPDPAAKDSFLGNGYFSIWCADVAWRLLERASRDPRYGFGEHTLTRWPWQLNNFQPLNEVIQVLTLDDNGDGQSDRSIAVPMPVFHTVSLMNSMDNRYWILPERTIGGQRIAGFASRNDKDLRILLFAQNPVDTQSRSDATFDVALDLSHLDWPRIKMESYQIDKKHNSCFPVARQVGDRFAEPPKTKRGDARQVKKLIERLERGATTDQLDALRRLKQIGPPASAALPAIKKAFDTTSPGGEVHKAVQEALSAVYYGPPRFVTEKEAREAERLSALRPTARQTGLQGEDGILHLRLTLAANGVNFTIVSPE